jgi:DNA polymerase-3 subunit gamma/tau|tara:strand:- start:1526 stop:2620 length:1095 start_codon:yes stop_codon:yes gene_type:complete
MLYNKYRPKTFSQVVGQEWIVRTLRNSITLDRVPHTLLFEGLRGTGKTTLARVFATAVNCVSPVEGDPCLECVSCQNSHKNILEVDAGSSRGVETIEDLHDTLRLRPLRGKFRTVIIDECHMLTEAAANAALKLFEEPPSHVVLVLCTTGQTNNPDTKVSKAFSTLASRCMRFKFAAVDIKDIYKKLRYICKQEGQETEDEVLRVIARKVRGSLRDAESLLDSAFTFSQAPVIRINDVRGLISIEEDKALELLEVLCSSRPFESIPLVAKFHEDGFNIPAVANECASLAAEALSLALDDSSFYSDSQRKRLLDTTKGVDVNFLVDMIKSLGTIKSSSFNDGKQDLEVALAGLSYSAAFQPSAAW